MLTCFNSKIRVTQKFGNELYFIKGKKKPVSKNTSGAYAYYAQFNLLGHNGLDGVPFDRTDLRMFNFFKGKIIKMENHEAYGNRIVLWNKKTKLMEYHCHMLRLNNSLKVGQVIKTGTLIGYMGSTGYSTGPHDHMAFRATDAKGYIVNRDNGYNGYIDPLKVIDD
jgi:murein DD-endopeptidase MepM/ murein hydrolase activator NlpD